jgi:YD repeat-containing protein
MVRRLLLAVAISIVVMVAIVFAGPVSSGALLLLVPGTQKATNHDLPESYKPFHKGHISLDNGLYYRQNEDLIVRGTPPLVLRRSYISSYRVEKEFGIGTTMAGEWYLVGDGKQFQWSALIRPGESRIQFHRTSRGTGVYNAMYRHDTSQGEWFGAQMGWTGIDWVVRRRDGALARFRQCGPDEKSICSIVRYRDADGHVVEYRRDSAGRLLRIEAADNRWIAFEYDNDGRVNRAHDNMTNEVRYAYDDRGRLSQVISAGKVTHKYTYTDKDEMATIIEPGTDIENIYEKGRCVRQVNRYADGSDPFIFDFAYHLNGSSIVGTDSKRSDGTWTTYTFSDSGYTTSEVWGRDDSEPATFVYERDPQTHAVVSLNLTCPDRTGRQLRHSSLVRPGEEEWIKWDLVRTHCSWTGRRSRLAE